MDGQGGNVFSNSLYQLGQYLLNNPQGQGLAGGNVAQNTPTKIVTQWHYGGAPGQSPQNVQTSPANEAPTTPPPMASPPVTQPPAGPAPAMPVSRFTPPGGQNVVIPQPGAVTPSSTGQPSAGRPGMGGGGAGGGAMGGGNYNVPDIGIGDTALANEAINSGRPATGPGSGQPTSSAISGVTSALSKGLTDAASAIGNVRTMPTPIQSGPFPTIDQFTPTLIGRRYV